MARAVLVACVALTAAILRAHPTLAEGAIAIGFPDVPAQGIALGIGLNYPTIKEAAAGALHECGGSGTTPTARSHCKVIKTFSRQCAAFSMDAESGTSVVGWGTGADQATADNEALTGCRATAWPIRASFCEVWRQGCDTSTDKRPAGRCRRPSSHGRRQSYL